MNSDLISRQTAISAICNACGKIDCDKMDKCEKLQLPPANSSEFPNSSDCISRQAAIELIERMKPYHQEADDIAEMIANMPSAQPEEDCDTCKHGYFGDDQCNNCRVRYPSHYERRTDD